MPQKPEESSSPHSTDFPDPEDTVISGARGFTPQALRLLLACSRQITLGLAHALSRWWRKGDPVRAGFAERMLVQVESIGALVKAMPPLRGYDDVVKRLVQMLDSFEIGGSTRIAQMFARAGVRIGRETVRRYRKAPRPPRPADLTKAF
jgi:hypothetical protein